MDWTISSSDRALDLVYLPIIMNNRTTGIIVKSIFSAHNPDPLDSQHKQNNENVRYFLDNIAGNNTKILEQKRLAIKAARTISTVLITGESGTGKEIFAHSIHNLSPRRNGPFIKVNCAAIPEALLESELFGYAEGAFTGARKEGKPGKFELADNGTIFLDEVADMSAAMQGKLLRVLQEKELERVGGIHATRINMRVIAATNQDLAKLVKEHKFREDLYYRLNVAVLNLPSLRERKDDIPLLSRILLQRLNEQLGINVKYIKDEVLNCFTAYDWPGNIRELENILERSINFCGDNVITLDNIPDFLRSAAGINHSPHLCNSLEKQMEVKEKEAILSALENSGGNKCKAAKYLQIHRSALYRKINKYNIDI